MVLDVETISDISDIEEIFKALRGFNDDGEDCPEVVKSMEIIKFNALIPALSIINVFFLDNLLFIEYGNAITDVNEMKDFKDDVFMGLNLLRNT
ncbi:unnamed protein product [Rotaria sp. Silwood1]|nr:unnamed protein product [Rotaria sp. Silwood1]CAF1130064.1 unnamed protein product [Rotaria sp. Silwood1]CAF1321625.1 unnamed protein product [Rotaria sp. Silwood1]CAF3462428.1 unnamed protein product [Rotaria sp. Silwood1]CAF3492220.1 unnamed protein product [Rotaria sp. Silwood1]